MKKSSRIRNKYDVKDLQKILGLSYIAVCRLCRDKKIKAMKIGPKYYIERKDLNNFLNRGSIFDKPEKVILDTLKQGIQEAIKQNIEKIILEAKQKIIEDITNDIQENLKEIDRRNVIFSEFFPKKIIDNLTNRHDEIKKELEKV